MWKFESYEFDSKDNSGEISVMTHEVAWVFRIWQIEWYVRHLYHVIGS